MVRNYIRKTERGKWDPEKMELACKAVNENNMSLRKAGISYDVPKEALYRRVNREANKKLPYHSVLGRFFTTFTPALEAELENYIVQMDESCYGLTIIDIQRVVYQFAIRNNIPNSFNKESGLAGRDYVEGFLKRHPKLSLRKPEAILINRMNGINKESVENYFDLLEKIVDEHKLQSNQIYNCDESGLTNVHKPVKVITTKGKRTISSATSGERGTTTTVLCALSASGQYVPPAMIFKRRRMKPELIDRAPPGTIGFCSKSGWIEMDIFNEYIKHFVKHVKCSREFPVLLVLDRRSTHTKNIDVIDFARDNGLLMLTIPPHSSHKLQPLDRGLFKSLKAAYNSACGKWMRSNPERVITPFQIGELFCEAYAKAATLENSMGGFRSCGVWPVDRSVIKEYEYAISDCGVMEPIADEEPEAIEITAEVAEQADEQANCSFNDILYILIIPPKKKIKRAEKSQIITSSPYKKNIEERNHKLANQHNSIAQLNKRGNAKNSLVNANKGKALMIQSKKNIKDCICLVCGEWSTHSRSGEKWIQCTNCTQWAHKLCTAYD